MAKQKISERVWEYLAAHPQSRVVTSEIIPCVSLGTDNQIAGWTADEIQKTLDDLSVKQIRGALYALEQQQRIHKEGEQKIKKRQGVFVYATGKGIVATKNVQSRGLRRYPEPCHTQKKTWKPQADILCLLMALRG